MNRRLKRWLAALTLVCLMAAPLAAVPDIGEFGEIIHDGEGIIDRIGDDGKIVIGDQLFRLSSQTVFYSTAGTPVSIVFFKVGTRVAYDLNTGGRIIVLYELEEKK